MDMDGVLVHEEQAIPGRRPLPGAPARARAALPRPHQQLDLHPPRPGGAPARQRAEVPEEAIFTSALATADFLHDQRPGGSAFVIGEAGLTTAMHEAGYTLTERDPDYVVLGETRIYSFGRITQAIRLIVNGARFIATNPDATGPSNEGPLPATGSVAALISRATGVDPYFVGKPNPFMMRSALNALDAHSETTAMIGDRMDTDVVSGLEAGLQTILVLTGVDHARGGRPLPLPRVARGGLDRRPGRRARLRRSDRNVGRDEPGLVGEDDGLHAVAQPELGEQPPDVGLDRVLARARARRRSRRWTGPGRRAAGRRSRGR